MPSISSVYMWSYVMMAMKLNLICLGLGVLKFDGAGAKLLGRATLNVFLEYAFIYCHFIFSLGGVYNFKIGKYRLINVQLECT